MNLDKSDLKILTAHELGCRLDDYLDANTKDMYRLEGGVTALRAASLSLDGLMKVVDKEMDEGKFDLEQAAHIKKFVQRAAQMVLNLALQHENNRIAQTGRVAALDGAVSIARKFKEEESKKVEALRLALAQNKITADGEVVEGEELEGARIPGLRPGMTVKERRLAEDAAVGEGVEVPTPSIVPTIKKRGRPKKVA